MSAGRRVWRSFIGGWPSQPSRTGERGREGYGLGSRFWASFINVELPPLRAAVVSPHETPAAVPGRRPRGGDPGWFGLSAVPAVSGLTAAGTDTVVLEESSPDGRARFLVRHRPDRPEYSLEVILRGTDAASPLMCAVRYTRADGTEQLLLVPVARARFGPPASYVHLPGFTAETASAAWAASGPAPVTASAEWDAETVAGSIRAARNEATREAWRQVRELVGDPLRGVIDGALT